MVDISQAILALNIVFVILVVFWMNRLLRAASKFNWNPGDGQVQNKQKFIILKTILKVAAISLIAAVINIFFG